MLIWYGCKSILGSVRQLIRANDVQIVHFFFTAIYFCLLIVQWRQRSNRLIYIPVAIAIDSKHLVFSSDGASIVVILLKITHKNGVPGHSKASAQVNFRARAPVIDTLDSCCTNKYHIRKMLLHQ